MFPPPFHQPEVSHCTYLLYFWPSALIWLKCTYLCCPSQYGGSLVYQMHMLGINEAILESRLSGGAHRTAAGISGSFETLRIGVLRTWWATRMGRSQVAKTVRGVPRGPRERPGQLERGQRRNGPSTKAPAAMLGHVAREISARVKGIPAQYPRNWQKGTQYSVEAAGKRRQRTRCHFTRVCVERLETRVRHSPPCGSERPIGDS